MTHAHAEKLFILGHPIAHSKSPAMYNPVYKKLGLPWTYGFADCPTREEAEAFLQARDFLSLNVTTPYKPLAFEVAGVRAATAQVAKGANVLVRKGDALIAYNVDGQGCVGYLERTGVTFAGARVVVCGTGPTALSILHAASQAGAAEVVLLGRNKERARAVLEEYAETYGRLAGATIDLPPAVKGHLSFRTAYEQVGLKFGSYATSTRAIAVADVVIDATPLGMCAGDPAPFDTALLSKGQTVFDVVYGHGETALVGAARSAGCAVHDGAGMLVAQAVATLGIVCDIAEVELPLSFDETFELMARAADMEQVLR